MTDKFIAVDPGVCARLCTELDECTHWSYGKQDGELKCFLRKSDAGREAAKGFSSASKACAPPPLPPAFVALQVAYSDGLKACDGGKSDQCPDALAGITTWKYAIKHLKRATEGRVDPTTWDHIEQIGSDSENLARQVTAEVRPSDADFPRIVYNNRLIFNALHSWLDSTPKVELGVDDPSLPNPIRNGKLCGQSSCYEF